MLILTLLFTLLSPSEENDQMLLERMEQNMQMIRSMESSKEPYMQQRSRGPLIQESGEILAFYFLPERMNDNEKGFMIIQQLLQEMRLLSYRYSPETMDQIAHQINALKKYISRTNLIDEKPWERGWEYRKREPLKRRSRKSDPRNPRCPVR